MQDISQGRSLLVMGASAVALAVLSAPAAAQTVPAAAAKPAAAADSAAQPIVIVTAEKRAANIQKVPEAVSAFTARQLNLVGILSIQDISDYTPGLTYSSQYDRLAIRGLGRLSNDLAADSAVAIYNDDFYITTTYNVGLDDLFVDRVEVERGPQGTLYGRNAIGGLINTFSKRPSDQFGGEVRAEYGNYDHSNFEATLTGPIANGLDFRLSAVKTDQSQGYFKNLAGGPGEGGVVHDWYAEAQLEWKPTDRDDAWLLLSSQGLDNDRSGPGALLGTPTLGAYNVSIIAPDSPAIFNPNFGYSRLSGFSPCLNPQLGCLPLPNQEPTGLALGPIPGSVTGAVPGLTNNPALTNIRNFAHSVPTNIRAGDTYNINFHYIHHFDGFDMKYVGGYMQYHYHLVSGLPDEDNSSITSYQIPLYPTGLCATGALGPCAPLTVFPSQVYSYNDYNRWMSHEITFSSTTNGPLQWIAGVYYFDEHYRSPITVAQPQQAQFAAPFYPLVPSATSPLNPFGLVPAPANPQRIWYNTSYALATQSTAGYVQLDYKVTDAVKLTGGVRYTYDKKYGDEEYRQLAFSDLLAAPPSNAFTAEDLGTSLPAIDITSAEIATGPYKGVTCLPFLLANGAYKRCLGDSSNAVTGTAGVEWTPDSATLAYIRYNRGYKAFGLNVGTIIADPEAKPEFVDDFEIGLKQTLGRTFQYSADAFYYNYVNDQVPVYVVSNALVQNEFFNIPRAVSEGFELQAEWDPIEHLDMTLTYAFDHTAILSGCNAANPQGSTCLIDAVDPSALAVGARPVGAAGGGYVYQSVKGGPLPQAPENKVSLNVNYTWEFDPGNFTLSGSYIWKDSSYPTVFKRWYYETPSWSQVDLRALWIGDHDRYEIIGFAKNLFNTIGYDAAFDAYGSTLPYGQDPAYELTPPRTYGVEVHVKF